MVDLVDPTGGDFGYSPRTVGQGLDELAAKLIRTPSEEVEASVVREARAIAMRAVATMRAVTAADAEDVAQHAARALAARLKEGRALDNPAAFVWRVAENRGRDLHRRKKRETAGMKQLRQEADVASPSVGSPEEIWLARERRAWVQARMRELVARAPKNYERALRRHYLEDEPIESLAEEVLRERLEGKIPSDPDALEQERRRARNLVDQHLKRGREWLRRELLAVEERGSGK